MEETLPFEGPLAVILQHISDGVMVHDTSGRLVYANDAVARAGGFASARAAMATAREDRLARLGLKDENGEPLDFERLPSCVTLRTGQPATGIVHTWDASDGDERTWSIRSFPEHSPDGSLRHAVSICRDVTNERRTAEQLRLHARRQARIAELGRKALAGMGILPLMEEIAAVVALKLAVPYACVLQHHADRGVLEVRASTGWQSSLAGLLITDAPDTALSSYTLAEDAPIEVADIRQKARFNCPAELLKQGVVSAVAVPIRHLGHPFGIISAYSNHQRAFSEDDVHFLESVANILAAAIERREAEDLIRAAGQRSTFLARASDLLAASLDYETTLSNVALLVTPEMADWCLIHLVDAHGDLRAVSVAHQDPEKAAWAEDLDRRFPPHPELSDGLWDVIRGGKPDLVAQLTDDILRRIAHDDEHYRLMRSTGIHSAMVVPMSAADRQVGCITFLRAENPRAYAEADLTLATDVTRRCAVAIENSRLYQQLQWADKAKDEFLAMLSHELRNPLGTIANGMCVLDAIGDQSEEARRRRDILRRQVDNMGRLLDDLLDVSRITRGRVELKREAVDLGALLRDAFEAMRPFMESRGHSVTMDLPRDTLCLFADRTRLEQVTSNLLANAAKYTDPGGEIHLAARLEGPMAVVTVRDTGIGITHELLPHVFDLFTQADRSLDRSQGGLGIGLTLVKSLVEMHGGTVSASSGGPGHGTTFTIRLPLSNTAGLPAIRPHAPTAPSGSVTRVLVVDDNEDAAETLSAILDLWGCEVNVAHDGPEALRAVRASRPDVILLDIGLPGMDGYEVARSLRDSNDTAHIRIIAVTGYGREEDREAARDAGFEHCLSKPVDMNSLKVLLLG